MKLPVNEKNLMNMVSIIESILFVGEKIELFTPVSIYKVCFTNARAM